MIDNNFLMDDHLSRITTRSEIAHGKPSIRGSRYTVEFVLEHLAAGDSVGEVIDAFPDLEREDVLACIAYATALLKSGDSKPITRQTFCF